MDKRGLKILFDTYSNSAGWQDARGRKTPAQDLDYAKSVGLMFDPVKLNHDEVLARLLAARDALDSRRVADAFLASLTSRRLELRSALGSFAVFRHLTPHRPVRQEKQCTVCGQYFPAVKEDLNVLNFERFKWGGVRHNDPLYAMLDLELLLQSEPALPTPQDIALFGSLVTLIESAPSETTAATLGRRWAGVLKSNAAERGTIVEILGFCGILETAEHHGYRTRFIPVSEQELPSRRFVDMAYPACWWTKSDGINAQALQEWFGHVL